MMDRLNQTISYKKKLEKGDNLSEYLRKMIMWIETFYSEIAKRVNWLVAGKYIIENHTSDDSLLENESDSLHTNLGATGTVTLTLPSSPGKGTNYKFAVQAAQELRIDPGTATIRDECGQTADKYKWANAIGECIELVADENGDWLTVSKYGTWTEEV